MCTVYLILPTLSPLLSSAISTSSVFPDTAVTYQIQRLHYNASLSYELHDSQCNYTTVQHHAHCVPRDAFFTGASSFRNSIACGNLRWAVAAMK